MSKVQLDVPAALARSRRLVEAVLRQTDDPARRASLLTDRLRSLWPSPLYACRFRAEGCACVSVRDEAGKQRTEWADLLRDKLAEGATTFTVPLPRALKLPGHALAVAEIAWDGHSWGVLALAARGKASAGTTAALRALLTTCAEQLAVSLFLEAHQRELKVLREEQAGQAWLADVGELAGPLMHEFNNFLNVVSLHAAALEPEVSEELRPELTAIRQQSAEVAALVHHFQQYRQQPQPVLRPVDLNHLVSDAAEELNQGHGEPGYGLRVNLVLAPDLPPVESHPPDLKRLLTFLFRHVASTAPAGNGVLTVRTERAPNHVVLLVEEAGPLPAAEPLAQLFESECVTYVGKTKLELLACKKLARRLRGSIRGENRPAGGAIILVELPLGAKD